MVFKRIRGNLATCRVEPRDARRNMSVLRTKGKEINNQKTCPEPRCVWIITEDYGQDNGIGIRGVFATKELAEAHKAGIGPRKRSRFDIEAHNIVTHNKDKHGQP